MAGIYIHIPFCKQACVYCNFHFSTSLKQKNDLVQALLREIKLTPLFNNNPTIETVYLGGGTPSMLEPAELQMILDAIAEKFTVAAKAEITLEANPDDINLDQLSAWSASGVNRLSIGIQSFYERDLQWMGRAHNADQAAQSVLLAQEAGFHNISTDLIYGTPGLSDREWEQNVSRIVEMKVPHISCYALTVEPATALNHQIKKHKKADVDPEQQSRQFLLLIDWLQQYGYEHYEISNFSLPGKRSRHNSSYWQGLPYYGLGPSAHSFDGAATRYWNIANNSQYIQSIKAGTLPVEKEQLTQNQQANEYIMTALRTMEGIDLNHVRNVFGETVHNSIIRNAKPLLTNKIEITDTCLRLTKEGKLFADGLAADLFLD